MVEHVAQSRDRKFMIYDANTGAAAGDIDRRHIFRVPVDHSGAVPLTSGDGIEWTPVAASKDRVAFVATGPQQPPSMGIVDLNGAARTPLDTGASPADFPLAQLIVPIPVTFKAADGT